jgi:hypothetical protein
MSVEKAKELRMELHYGINYLEKAVGDGTNKTNALAKLVEARSSMMSYISALRDTPYFKATEITSNNVIEMDPDVVDEKDLPGDVSPSVENTKLVISGLNGAVNKLLTIRLSRMQQLDPTNSYRALRALDRGIDALENGIGYLFNELQEISAKSPGTYPTFEPEEAKPEMAYRPVPSDVDTTNSVMEERAGGTPGPTDPAAEVINEDPADPDQGLEDQSEGRGNPENGDGRIPSDSTGGLSEGNGIQGPTPSDPTEGFSEANTTEKE